MFRFPKNPLTAHNDKVYNMGYKGGAEECQQLQCFLNHTLAFKANFVGCQGLETRTKSVFALHVSGGTPRKSTALG